MRHHLDDHREYALHPAAAQAGKETAMAYDRKDLNDTARAIIAKGMAYRNLSSEDIQKMLDISKSTLERRMADPATFTLREIQVLSINLHLNPIDRCALVAPMSKSEIKDFILA